MGSAIHHAIAARIKGENVAKAIAEFNEAKLKDIEPKFDLIPSLVDDWEVIKGAIEKDVPWIVDAWTNWVKLDEWETVVHPTYGPLVERKMVTVFELWNGEEFEFIWIADWVAKNKATELTWLIDWKSTMQFKDDRAHEFALQKMVYQHLLSLIDVTVSGSRVAQIKPTQPAIPELNKNGSMSRKAISTTWDRYKQALEAEGLDPADYVDMQEKLKSPDDWFSWCSAYRSDAECRNAWEEVIIPTVNRMANIPTKFASPIRNLGSLTCQNMCSVKLICMETLRGRPLEGLLDFGFEVKTANIVEAEIKEDEDGVQSE